MKHRFRKILLGLVLGMGVLVGSPMLPEEIEELMCSMSQTQIEYVIRGEGDDIIRKLLGQGD